MTQALHTDDTDPFGCTNQAPRRYSKSNLTKGTVRRKRVRLSLYRGHPRLRLSFLPRQSERKPNDWMSIVDLRLDDLPTFDPGQ